MARHRKYDLLERVVSAIEECDWNVLYLSSIDEHPFTLRIYHEDQAQNILVYIWHLTHGGGAARPENEYRIQITGTDQFKSLFHCKTLILGLWDELEVFAGFDFRKHTQPLGISPSMQIRRSYLEQASTNGFSPCDKGNQEIAIAFRPDFFVEYVRNLEILHDFGQSAHDLSILDAVLENPEINDDAITISDTKRKIAVVTMSRKLRAASFRKRVLRAYRSQCAVCGVQLRLVDAAHIIPVNYEKSTDETRNGLALCALHHRAYDKALITVLDDYTVRINDTQVDDMRSIDEDGGLDRFSTNLLNTILLPKVVSDRPHVEYIRIANQVRGWDL